MMNLTNILSGLMLLGALSATAGISSEKGNKPYSAQGNQHLGQFPKDMIFDTSKMQNFHFSTDDITDPKERETMRINMRNSSQRATNINAPRKENEKLCTVKCVFKGEDMPYFAIYNPDFFLESSYRIWDESGETDTYYFQVPAGTYDVYTQYYSRVEGMNGWGNLVHENVSVNANTEVNFSADELTEKVVIRPLLRNGKEALLPIGTYLDEEPWLELDYTNSTATFSYLSDMLFREGCKPLSTGMAVADYTPKGSETVFLSNILSDKYHYVFQYVIEDSNGEIQVTTTDMIGSESGTVNNYIKDFVKYDVPEFSHTPVYDEFGDPKFHASITGLLWLNDIQVGGGGKYTEKANPEIYCALQPTNDGIDLKAPVIVNNIQAEQTVTFEQELENGEIVKFSETFQAEMVALPAIYNGSEWEYINQNHSECGNFSYQRPEEGPIVEYPGVPAYCYFADQITQPIGNSSPVLALMTQINKFPDATIFRFEPQAYIGRYGEVRNCDQWNLLTVVKLNGDTVFDSTNGGYLDDWCIENSLNNHEKGIVEATFINRNVLVDETVKGFNITSIKVDERNEDRCTPTTQMLIFKNADGVITDRFQTGEDGIIEFSAGDFNWVDTGDNWYYACEEANVKVEYAPYGEETFAPLEVEEIPENYFMPGFGYFYRGSLADVTMPSSNGWYDIRFTLTDKAGNEMVQHISPAFKIDKNVGVTEVAVNGTKVWAANGTVFAAGSDVAAMELFTADGKRIASSNGNSLSANGYRGIAIVKAIAADGSASTHKVAIR